METKPVYHFQFDNSYQNWLQWSRGELIRSLLKSVRNNTLSKYVGFYLSSNSHYSWSVTPSNLFLSFRVLPNNKWRTIDSSQQWIYSFTWGAVRTLPDVGRWNTDIHQCRSNPSQANCRQQRDQSFTWQQQFGGNAKGGGAKLYLPSVLHCTELRLRLCFAAISPISW